MIRLIRTAIERGVLRTRELEAEIIGTLDQLGKGLVP